MDFQAVTALNRPDFRTISEFRRRHLAALSELFVQVLALCQKAGLVGLGHIAVDGTKLRANASKHKAMSYERMVKAECELAAEVASWLDKAAEVDAMEDPEHGPDQRGDETPDWMANKQQRLARIRAPSVAISPAVQAEPWATPPALPLKPRQKLPPLRRKQPTQIRPARRTAPRPSGEGPSPHAYLACPNLPHRAISPIPRAGSC